MISVARAGAETLLLTHKATGNSRQGLHGYLEGAGGPNSCTVDGSRRGQVQMTLAVDKARAGQEGQSMCCLDLQFLTGLSATCHTRG